jgi:hypothetical protein
MTDATEWAEDEVTFAQRLLLVVGAWAMALALAVCTAALLKEHHPAVSMKMVQELSVGLPVGFVRCLTSDGLVLLLMFPGAWIAHAVLSAVAIIPRRPRVFYSIYGCLVSVLILDVIGLGLIVSRA